jgi:hypothetical protein
VVRLVGKLSEEDLGRWRMSQARLHAIEKKAEAFSINDIEQAYIAGAKLLGEFCERYEINDAENWVVSSHTGVIYYNG